MAVSKNNYTVIYIYIPHGCVTVEMLSKKCNKKIIQKFSLEILPNGGNLRDTKYILTGWKAVSRKHTIFL